MKIPVINASYRNEVGKGNAHRLRSRGKIPAIIYDTYLNKTVEIDKKDLDSLLLIYGNNALVEVQLEGNKIKCIPMEIQHHPVHGEIIHVDLKPVDDDTRIHMQIPIRFLGMKDIERSGGILQKQRQEVEVQCPVNKVPKYINADIRKLAVGQSFTVQDMEIAEELTLLTKPTEVLVTLTVAKDYSKLQESEVDNHDE